MMLRKVSLGFFVAAFAVVSGAPETIDIQGYSTIPKFDCYYDLEGAMDWIKNLVEAYAESDILEVELVDIGDSWVKTKAFDPANQQMLQDVTDGLYTEGFDIYALTITAKQSTTAYTKAPFLMVSSTHSREYTPPQLVLNWLETLLEKVDGDDADTLALLEHTKIHWIPYLNPDARVVAETRQKWRRKNLNIAWTGDIIDSKNCARSRFGVDLNRNFPFEWGDNTGSSDYACSEVTRGLAPASEPETKALVEYAERVFPPSQRLQNALVASGGDYSVEYDPNTSVEGSSTKWKGFDPTTTQGCFIDVHSFGNFYVYPWGNKEAMAPNDVSFRTVLGNLQQFTNNEAMRPGPQNIGLASGAIDDWAYGVLGAMAMTWELGNAFHESCSSFQNHYEKHFRSLNYLAKITPFPFAFGKGPLIEEIAMASSITLHYTTLDGTTELVRNAIDDDDYLLIEIRASLPNTLPSSEDPIVFEDGGTSDQPLGTEINNIRIYHQNNPLVGLIDLQDIGGSEFWDTVDVVTDPESPPDVYTVRVDKSQLWQAFGPNGDTSNNNTQQYPLYFQAMDNAENWGPLTTVRLEISLLPKSDCTEYDNKRVKCKKIEGCYWRRGKKKCKPCDGIKRKNRCKKKGRCGWRAAEEKCGPA